MAAKGSFKPFCKYGHPRTRESVTKDGFCKTCMTLRNTAYRKSGKGKKKHAAWQRIWAKKNPDSVFSTKLKVLYGITPEQYEMLLLNQKGKCAICPIVLDKSTRKTFPCVDHNHACCPSGKSCGKCIRGLLCARCNSAIGLFNESIEVMFAGIKYLKETTQKCPNEKSIEYEWKALPIPMDLEKSLQNTSLYSQMETTA